MNYQFTSIQFIVILKGTDILHNSSLFVTIGILAVAV